MKKINTIVLTTTLAAMVINLHPSLESQPYIPDSFDEQSYLPEFFEGQTYPCHEYVPPGGHAYNDSWYAPKLIATVIIGAAAVAAIGYALTHTPGHGHAHSGSSSSQSSSGH